MKSSLIRAWDTFFYSRLGSQGCRFVGGLRMAFAFLFVADRLMLTLDIPSLLSPSRSGLVPLWLGREMIESSKYTIFQLAAESDALLWCVHGLGIVQGILLFLGVAPRVQMMGLFFNLVSFQHHNQVIWDGEDMMFKAFCVNFLFMPLHRRTIYDGFGLKHAKDDDNDDSWPMWPIRLFQIEMSLIYIGASVGKINGDAWLSGVAIYFITYSTDFYPGIYNPDFLFDRLWALKLMTWSALFLETTSWWLVWIPSCRIPVVFSMIMLHMGIEITMNMHCFEWLAIIGWLVFLLQPDARQEKTLSSVPSSTRLFTNSFLVFYLVWTAVFQIPSLVEVVPTTMVPMVQKIEHIQSTTAASLSIFLNPVGFYLEPFDMYDGGWGWQRFDHRAEIVLHDGSVRHWESPQWIGMSNLARKRNMRLMNYYASMGGGGFKGLNVQLLRTLARELESNGEDFIRITLFERVETAPDPKEGVGWFEPVRSAPSSVTIPILDLYPAPKCRDHPINCEPVHDGLACDRETARMCPKSCRTCSDEEYQGLDYVWRFHHGNFDTNGSDHGDAAEHYFDDDWTGDDGDGEESDEIDEL